MLSGVSSTPEGGAAQRSRAMPRSAAVVIARMRIPGLGDGVAWTGVLLAATGAVVTGEDVPGRRAKVEARRAGNV